MKRQPQWRHIAVMSSVFMSVKSGFHSECRLGWRFNCTLFPCLWLGYEPEYEGYAGKKLAEVELKISKCNLRVKKHFPQSDSPCALVIVAAWGSELHTGWDVRWWLTDNTDCFKRDIQFFFFFVFFYIPLTSECLQPADANTTKAKAYCALIQNGQQTVSGAQESKVNWLPPANQKRVPTQGIHDTLSVVLLFQCFR